MTYVLVIFRYTDIVDSDLIDLDQIKATQSNQIKSTAQKNSIKSNQIKSRAKKNSTKSNQIKSKCQSNQIKSDLICAHPYL